MGAGSAGACAWEPQRRCPLTLNSAAICHEVKLTVILASETIIQSKHTLLHTNWQIRNSNLV